MIIDENIWNFVTVAESTECHFDDFDVSMCVETITVKPMYIDDPDEAHNYHEPSLSITSDRDNGIFVTGIDNNRSILDDKFIGKTNEYDHFFWSGKEDIEEKDVKNQCNLQLNHTSLAKDYLKCPSSSDMYK